MATSQSVDAVRTLASGLERLVEFVIGLAIVWLLAWTSMLAFAAGPGLTLVLVALLGAAALVRVPRRVAVYRVLVGLMAVADLGLLLITQLS